MIKYILFNKLDISKKLSLYLPICIFTAIIMISIGQSPMVNRLEYLRIHPSEASVLLGDFELGRHLKNGGSSTPHLAVRQANGQWEIANVSANRPVDILTSKHSTLFLKRLRLETGDTIHLGDRIIKVTHSDAQSIILNDQETGSVARWMDGKLQLSPDPTEVIGFFSATKRGLRWRMRQLEFKFEWFPSFFKRFLNNALGLFPYEELLFHIGGSIHLHNQWAVGQLPVKATSITWFQGGFYLAPGTEHLVYIDKNAQGTAMGFRQRWLSLDGSLGTVQRLVIGRTYYNVSVLNGVLELRPERKINIVPEITEVELGPVNAVEQKYIHQTWIGAGISLIPWLTEHVYEVLKGFLWGLGLWVIIWHLSAYYNKKIHLSLYIACPLFWIHRVLSSSSTSIDIRWALVVWFVTWLWVAWTLNSNNRLKGGGLWIWNFATVMAALGVLTQMQLAAGSENTRWLEFAWKQIYFTTICGWLIGLIGNIPNTWFRNFLNRMQGDFWHKKLWAWIKLSLFSGLLLLLLVMAIGGDEKGLGLVQPTELMKLVIVVLAASTAVEIIESRVDSRPPGKIHWQRKILLVMDVGFLLLVMFVSAVVSLLWIRDISPLLILFAFLLWWIWQISKHISVRSIKGIGLGKIMRGSVLLTIVGILLFALSVYHAPQKWSILPESERLHVWSKPHTHPISGSQVLEAMSLIGAGGFFGAEESWFGRNVKGNELPAVQDDFALAFFLYKFGAGPGLLLLLTQMAYLYYLMKSSRGCIKISGYFAQRRAGLLMGLTVQGLVIIHMLQWAIAWGNSLGMIPVMGQPMTWLSSGNSHMTSVGLPLLLFGFLSIWLFTEHDSD